MSSQIGRVCYWNSRRSRRNYWKEKFPETWFSTLSLLYKEKSRPSKTISELEARLKVLIIENEEFQSVKGELQVKSISENLEIKRGGRDRLGVVE